ncbi:MAG: phosphopyruvate hydratase [Deltaproteobacteria bacterium]|nr:phosphopyruvate hydratase [Deltaproteobacteria bacterium]
MRIKRVHAREVLDSRGRPTVEVDVVLKNGVLGRATVPSGASTGKHEAIELRDGGTRFMGRGVKKAVRNVNLTLAPRLRGMEARDQERIDHRMIELDKSPDKRRLGANAILGVSLAVARAQAEADGLSFFRHLGGRRAKILPVPMFNVLNGGVHSDNNLDVQEFMIIPLGMNRFSEALRAGAEIYETLKGVLARKGLSTSVGDEGGFSPRLKGTAEAIELLLEAITKAGYQPGAQVSLGLDVAASELYKDGHYDFKKSNEGRLDKEDLVRLYEGWVRQYPIVSIEDPLSEDDWEGWKLLTEVLGEKVQIVGDDIFVTNKERFQRGIDLGIANSILIKVNQIGTLSETLEIIRLAKKSGYSIVISHRSGETEDTTIADLAVATDAGQIKAGAPCRGERTAKYNQLVRIEEELGKRAVFAGREALSAAKAISRR